MAADGIKMSHFTNQSTIQATSAAGSYRRIIQKPSQLVFDIVEMQLEAEDLLTPNYLDERDPTPKVHEPSAENGLPPITKAVRMRFNLTTSSYATMILREITRTSSAFYAQRNFSKAN
jgi:tRNA(Glu) U13 pseudouridine synthase TruD